ncbi:hypothetical protein [Streptomyces atratus]|uniref:hypothetical protein n=1 Tax=Streptomyces atratus TaxID=1893 RepID=UPI0036565205
MRSLRGGVRRYGANRPQGLRAVHLTVTMALDDITGFRDKYRDALAITHPGMSPVVASASR